MIAIRTPDQRLRIFVSSTMKELAGARVAARSAIERLRLIPVLSSSAPDRTLHETSTLPICGEAMSSSAFTGSSTGGSLPTRRFRD
jgi:Domain of unknown function (DUF4062)